MFNTGSIFICRFLAYGKSTIHIHVMGNIIPFPIYLGAFQIFGSQGILMDNFLKQKPMLEALKSWLC